MTCYRKVPVYLLLAAALLFATGAGAGGGIMPKNKVPGSVEIQARWLMHGLKKQGFEVSRGYFKLWTVDDCGYTSEKIGSCYGNNPAAPYVIMTLPSWPEEFVDPVFGNLWGPSKAGYHDIYRLDPREAIVILGQLPPPGAFFSEQTWLFTRQGAYDKNSDTYKNVDQYLHDLLPILFANVPGRDNRIQVLSSLSNPNNNVVIERKSGAAFDRIRYFIITPDQVMDKAVRKAFAHIWVDDKKVFTEPVPSGMNFGLDQSADDFTSFIRYAKPDDGGEPGTRSDAWRNNLPLVVLRVRDSRSKRLAEPYPQIGPEILETRGGVDEWPLKPDLGNLLHAVGERWGQSCAKADCSDRSESFINLQGFPAYIVGPLCIQIGENCLLDTWDTSYHIYGPGSVDNGEVYAVAGALGTKTKNATYVGFGVNQRSVLKGVANLFDEDLDGTANEYAKAVGNTDKLYLYYFTRDCSGLENLTDGHCFSLPEKLIPSGDQFVFSVRDYIAKGTQRGPDSSLVLPPTVIKLKRP